MNLARPLERIVIKIEKVVKKPEKRLKKMMFVIFTSLSVIVLSKGINCF
jgi:hypothetical protein